MTVGSSLDLTKGNRAVEVVFSRLWNALTLEFELHYVDSVDAFKKHLLFHNVKLFNFICLFLLLLWKKI